MYNKIYNPDNFLFKELVMISNKFQNVGCKFLTKKLIKVYIAKPKFIILHFLKINYLKIIFGQI